MKHPDTALSVSFQESVLLVTVERSSLSQRYPLPLIVGAELIIFVRMIPRSLCT